MRLFSDEVLGKKWTKETWNKDRYVFYSGGYWQADRTVLPRDDCWSVNDDDWIEYIPPKAKRKVTLYRYTIREDTGLHHQWNWTEVKNPALFHLSKIVLMEVKEIEVDCD
jgi:hypothetical protein